MVAVHDYQFQQGQRMVMFGGRAGTQVFQDAYYLTLNSTPVWKTEPTVLSPPPKAAFGSAFYDPGTLTRGGNRMVYFGGTDLTSDGSSTVWELDFNRSFGPSQWFQVTTYGTPPPPRYAHSAIYDPVKDRMIVFGGKSNASVYNDLWELRFSGPPGPNYPYWASLTYTGTPPPRYGHSATYDPEGITNNPDPNLNGPRMIVLGGTVNETVGPAADGDNMKIWSLSLPATGTPTWTSRLVFNAPPARFYHSAVYDPQEKRILLFGGKVQHPYVQCDDNYVNQAPVFVLWFMPNPEPYAEFGWGAYVPATPPNNPIIGKTYAHVAVYDPQPPNNRMIKFGGRYCGTSSITNDTWQLSLQRNLSEAEWTRVPSTYTAAAAMNRGETATDIGRLTATPNPVSSSTRISMRLGLQERVNVSVFDVSGRLVKALVDGGQGAIDVTWDARDSKGLRVASGIYFIVVKGEATLARRRLVVLD